MFLKLIYNLPIIKTTFVTSVPLYKKKIFACKLRESGPSSYWPSPGTAGAMSQDSGWDWWRVQGRVRSTSLRWSWTAWWATCPSGTAVESGRNRYTACVTSPWIMPTSTAPAKTPPAKKEPRAKLKSGRRRRRAYWLEPRADAWSGGRALCNRLATRARQIA